MKNRVLLQGREETDGCLYVEVQIANKAALGEREGVWKFESWVERRVCYDLQLFRASEPGLLWYLVPLPTQYLCTLLRDCHWPRGLPRAPYLEWVLALYQCTFCAE